MDIKKYIERIGFQDELLINEESLKKLHKCHVMSIPFEALDVYIGKQIELKISEIFNKVIIKKRGGYCYELNSLFSEFLTEVGFENYVISARIFDGKKFGPEYDHMAIIVKLKDLWLVDVGYGDLFLEPVKINSEIQQEDYFKLYNIKKWNLQEYILSESLKGSNEFRVIYKFEDKPRKISAFDEQNTWKQRSQESYFVKNKICTLPTKNGRKTILNNSYKIRIDNEIKHFEINSETRFIEILKNEFNIVLEKMPNNREL